MDDPDITGLLHKELIFLKLPSLIANKHLYGSINSRGRDLPAKRHLILLDFSMVTALLRGMKFTFLNCRILKNCTFLRMGYIS